MTILEFLVVGLGLSAASAFILTFCAHRCRTAPLGSFWASEWAATAAALLLVALLVISVVWTTKALLLVIGEPFSAFGLGVVITSVTLAVFLRIAGPKSASGIEASA